jgi:hypothetical protein
VYTKVKFEIRDSFHVELMRTENFWNSLLDTGFFIIIIIKDKNSSARDGPINTEERHTNVSGG